MSLDRRFIIKAGTASSLAWLLPRAAGAQPSGLFAPQPGAWRTYEIATRIEIKTAEGRTQAWIPVPSFSGEGWIKPGETTWSIAGGEAVLVRDSASGASMVHAMWQPAGTSATIEVKSLFEARDRAVALDGKSAPGLSAEQRRRYTSATELQPLDGIVKETADKVTAGAASDLDKARRIYDWIVDNTFRDPKTRGCGTGDIASMLKTGNLSGKCADLNALFVGLARASGVPARDIYGIRVAPSGFGYKSLGANAAVISKAQHCRAEVFVEGAGWIPADPADVRKVVLEEPPGKLALDDPKVVAVRKALFGAWETNWLAYNDAHDVVLPGSAGPRVPFLMYPQGETAKGRLDPLEPDAFGYAITARAIA